MPRWGLTAEMVKAGPWGLDPDSVWLKPRKIVTDPIHGDIYLNELEIRIVDSEPFQRLRRVRQLGNTHLVYPGATHSRFAHSLGTLRVAQDLIDAVVDQRSGPHPVPDLFDDWVAEEGGWRRIAEATMLARLGALLHDFCHIPFGHSLEDDLRLLTAHDQNAERFEHLWAKIDDDVLAILSSAESVVGRKLEADLRPLILSKEGHADSERPNDSISYPFVADIVGNTICADLIDYLQRDHRYTGLPAQLGHRFIHGFYVTSQYHPTYPQRVALKIRRPDGAERRDAISELLKYLRYRYELSERALEHHTKLAADAMVGKAIEMWYDRLWLEEAASREEDLSVDIDIDASSLRSRFEASHDAGITEAVSRAARERLETEVVARGDDGFLEALVRFAEAEPNDSRMRAVRFLVNGVLTRKLFKPIARHSGKRHARRIFEQWGRWDARRRLEQRLAAFAEIRPGWSVVLWIPPETMRLKPAEVLVDDGREVVRLVDHESSGLDRGRDIYQSHENLWSVNVFVEPSVPEEQREVVSARAAELLGIGGWDRESLPSSSWRLAARRIARAYRLSADHERQLETAVTTPTRPTHDHWTFADVEQEVKQTAHQLGLIEAEEIAGARPLDLPALVRELLVRADAYAVPVPLARVARELGVEVREDERMDPKEDGRLVQMAPPGSVQSLPVIYLNANKDPARRRFTLAHEIGHLHLDTVPEYANAARGVGSHGRRERLMNAFAAELLMPTDLLSRVLLEAGEDVAAVSSRFAVSRAAAERRLRDWRRQRN